MKKIPVPEVCIGDLIAAKQVRGRVRKIELDYIYLCQYEYFQIEQNIQNVLLLIDHLHMVVRMGYHFFLERYHPILFVVKCWRLE